jgi:hypothetical protein
MACIQPSYIPWRGFFDIIARCDVFIHYDDAQFTKQSWRMRNRIKTPHGTKWMSVGLQKPRLGTPVNEVLLSADSGWAQQHWRRLEESYKAAPHFHDYADALRALYEREWTHLWEMDLAFTKQICEWLKIDNVEHVLASSLPVTGTSTARLLSMCEAVDATHYLSGPAAQSYIDPADFEGAGVGLEWMAYDYPEYEQLHPPWEPMVTVLDLLFMQGDDAGRFIWGDASLAK